METAFAATDPNIGTRLRTGHDCRVTAWKPNRTSSRLLENHRQLVRTQLRGVRTPVLRRQTTSDGKPVLGLALHEKRHEIPDWGLVESTVNGGGNLGHGVLGHLREGCVEPIDGLPDQPVFLHRIHVTIVRYPPVSNNRLQRNHAAVGDRVPHTVDGKLFATTTPVTLRLQGCRPVLEIPAHPKLNSPRD